MPSFLYGSFGILGLLGIKFHWPDLNPFHWIRDWLKDIYKTESQAFQTLILNRPHLPSGLWQYSLYGNSLGLAEKLVLTILILTAVVVLFLLPQIGRLPYAFAVLAGIFAVGPYFFALSNWLSATGDQLAQAVVPKSSNGSNLLLLPQINNILLLIAALVVVLVLGFIIVVILFSNVLTMEIVKVAFLPTLSLTPLGQFPKRVMMLLIQFGLVIALLSPVVTAGPLSLAKVAADNVNSSGASFFFLVVALLLAIVLNVTLLFMAWYGTTRVTGKIRAVVQGRVETFQRLRQEVIVRNPFSAQQSLMQHVQVSHPTYTMTAGSPHPDAVRQSAATIRKHISGNEDKNV